MLHRPTHPAKEPHHEQHHSEDVGLGLSLSLLTGTVSSGWEEVNAVRLTRQVAGVRGIENQLKIDEKAETARSN